MPPSGPNSAIQVEVTTLPFIPGATVRRYLGRINLHFIKESWAVREKGGLGQFFHTFLSEVRETGDGRWETEDDRGVEGNRGKQRETVLG